MKCSHLKQKNICEVITMIKDLIKNFKVIKYVFKFCPLYALFSAFYILSNVVISLLRVALIAELGQLIVDALLLANPIDGFETIVKTVIVYIVIILSHILGHFLFIHTFRSAIGHKYKIRKATQRWLFVLLKARSPCGRCAKSFPAIHRTRVLLC